MKIDELIIKSLPSSFVFRNVKLLGDNGSGEAKLHIGSANNFKQYDDFFNNYDQRNQYYFNKENMLMFLEQIKIEYVYQSINKYSEVNYTYWEQKYNEIEQLNSENFEFELSKFKDSSRYYIRSKQDIFNKIFRKISLPKITTLVIEKHEDGDRFKYLFFLTLNLDVNNYELLEEEFQDANIEIEYSHNRIVFGAPGTGKSYKIYKDIKDNNLTNQFTRVTFHPNYTYSQFVGAYKPVKVLDEKSGKESVSYSFVPGPFLRILIKALKDENQGIPHVLVIEEVNRANPAAVFGDVFQLLDRDENGKSTYIINMSAEMEEYVKCELGSEIDELYIPSNMYIWATMNSADQGVYPIDSAFKRRWSFEYIGIDENSKELEGTEYEFIKLKNPEGSYTTYKWNEVRTTINMMLKDKVNEDKLLGPFFLSKAELLKSKLNQKEFDNIFKSKVLMYLYEDIIKHKKIDFFVNGVRTLSDIMKAYDNGKVFNFEIKSDEEIELNENKYKKVGLDDNNLAAEEIKINYSTKE